MRASTSKQSSAHLGVQLTNGHQGNLPSHVVSSSNYNARLSSVPAAGLSLLLSHALCLSVSSPSPILLLSSSQSLTCLKCTTHVFPFSLTSFFFFTLLKPVWFDSQSRLGFKVWLKDICCKYRKPSSFYSLHFHLAALHSSFISTHPYMFHKLQHYSISADLHIFAGKWMKKQTRKLQNVCVTCFRFERWILIKVFSYYSFKRQSGSSHTFNRSKTQI